MGPTPELRAKLGACYKPDVYGPEEGKKNPNVQFNFLQQSRTRILTIK